MRLSYVTAETHRIIDGQSAYITFNNYGPVIVEGIDKKQMPIGKWKSSFLLKRVGVRREPGIVGNKEVLLYQAVSNAGFPKDVILW